MTWSMGGALLAKKQGEERDDNTMEFKRV